MVPFECHLFVVDSSRTSVGKPFFFCMSQRESKCNEHLHTRENHFRYVLSNLRRIPGMEAVIIARKSKEVLPKGSSQSAAP